MINQEDLLKVTEWGKLAMKILIVSDIHGSARYCRMLLDAYRNERTDRMLLLGDILYHGPRNDLPEEYDPKSVIEMLNSFRDEIYGVRGNCEAEVDQMVLAFPVLADYALIPAGGKMIFATHGHIFNRKHLPPMKRGDILLHGHTHIPACEQFDGFVYMNPGSVSIPKEGSVNSYMIFDGTVFAWKTIEGEEYRRYSLENGCQE